MESTGKGPMFAHTVSDTTLEVSCVLLRK